MSKTAADSFCFITKTGSHSTTASRRGHFQVLVAKAKPEMMKVNGLKEQEDLLVEELRRTEKRLAEINKKKTVRLPPPEFARLMDEKTALADRVIVLGSKIGTIKSLRKRAHNITFAEVYREVAELVLPDELRHRVYDAAVEVIMEAKKAGAA